MGSAQKQALLDRVMRAALAKTEGHLDIDAAFDKEGGAGLGLSARELWGTGGVVGFPGSGSTPRCPSPSTLSAPAEWVVRGSGSPWSSLGADGGWVFTALAPREHHLCVLGSLSSPSSPGPCLCLSLVPRGSLWHPGSPPPSPFCSLRLREAWHPLLAGRPPVWAHRVTWVWNLVLRGRWRRPAWLEGRIQGLLCL